MSRVYFVRGVRRTAAIGALVAMILAPSVHAQQPAAAAQASAATLQLSMDQAVAMALETNLGLKADRLGIGIASEDVAGAQSAFRPQLRSSFSRSTSDQLPQNFTEGTAVVSSGSSAASATLFQNLAWYGGGYSVAWQGNRTTTTASLSPFNPRLGSSLSMSFSQPVWRNFKIDSNRYTLQSAQRSREIADLTLEQRIASLQNAVQQAYLSLIASVEGQNVAQQNMDLAQENLKNFRARVAVGVSADIDVIQADAQVATVEEQVIIAEASISTAEDALRALIVDPSRPDYWQIHLKPSDTISAAPRAIDLDAATRNALANRLDLLTARRQRDITGLALTLDENQIKPDVSLGLNYTAQGTGGVQFGYGTGFPPPVVSRADKGFSSVLGDTLGAAYPSWTTSVTFNYPLGLSAAKASLARTRLQQQQQDLGIRDLEVQVAADVRNAARDVETNFKRVESTRKARVATERQLDAEDRKFGVGLSTSFELQQRQRDLAQARINELNATILYNRALIAFERVQKIQ